MSEAKFFKDDLREDISVFVDVTEFGELTWVDGVLLPCQITEHTAYRSSRQNENFAGLHGDFVKIHFPTVPYVKKHERIPRHGEEVYVNGKRYDVESARDDAGITTLICPAYRQNTLRQRAFGQDDPYGGLVE